MNENNMGFPVGLYSTLSPQFKKNSLNIQTLADYYKRLRLIATTMFEWENLPDSCDERFLEQVLYFNGRAIFIEDETLGFLNLRCTPAGELNIYELPVRWMAYSIAYHEEYETDECVIIRNNYAEIPTDETVALFALRLAEVERTLDVNIKSQKTPVLIKSSEKQRLTMKNLYEQYDGNQPFIFGDNTLDDGLFTVLRTDAPFVGDKLIQYKHEIWNEAMTFFGIKNSNMDKKERMITDEVNANNEQVSMMTETGLATRKQACELINEKWGLDVNVRLRTDKEIADYLDINFEDEVEYGEEEESVE